MYALLYLTSFAQFNVSGIIGLIMELITTRREGSFLRALRHKWDKGEGSMGPRCKRWRGRRYLRWSSKTEGLRSLAPTASWANEKGFGSTLPRIKSMSSIWRWGSTLGSNAFYNHQTLREPWKRTRGEGRSIKPSLARQPHKVCHPFLINFCVWNERS